LANAGQSLSTTRSQEPIIAHFNKAFGQDVLQETADELLGCKRTGPEFAGVGGAVTKGYFPLGQFQDAVVADGHPKDVGRQIPQGGETTTHWLAMDDPSLPPDRGWNEVEKRSLAQGIAELGADNSGERFHRK
jgi:hypothetical protein